MRKVDLQSFFMGVETNKNMQFVLQVKYLGIFNFIRIMCMHTWVVWNEDSMEETFFSPMYSKKTQTPPPHRSWVFLHRVEKKHANCARDYPHANPNIRTYIIYKPIHTTHIEFFIPFARGLDIDPFELIALLTYFFRTLYNKW